MSSNRKKPYKNSEIERGRTTLPKIPPQLGRTTPPPPRPHSTPPHTDRIMSNVRESGAALSPPLPLPRHTRSVATPKVLFPNVSWPLQDPTRARCPPRATHLSLSIHRYHELRSSIPLCNHKLQSNATPIPHSTRVPQPPSLLFSSCQLSL